MPRDIETYTVQVTDTIRTAMLKITANRCRAVVVLDGDRVVGIVSDGDIRRAFLRDVLPIAPVEHIMNLNYCATRETAAERQREIIRSEKVTVLPVVDEANHLLDVVVAYEPLIDG